MRAPVAPLAPDNVRPGYETKGLGQVAESSRPRSGHSRANSFRGLRGPQENPCHWRTALLRSDWGDWGFGFASARFGRRWGSTTSVSVTSPSLNANLVVTKRLGQRIEAEVRAWREPTPLRISLGWQKLRTVRLPSQTKGKQFGK